MITSLAGNKTMNVLLVPFKILLGSCYCVSCGLNAFFNTEEYYSIQMKTGLWNISAIFWELA